MSTSTLVINPVVGVAGDMLLALLIDLGAPEDPVFNAIAQASYPYEVHLEASEVSRAQMRARHCEVVYDAAVDLDLVQLRARIEASPLGDLGLAVALSALDFLEAAEREVHGPQGDVHLHELGSLDTLIDLVGVGRALEELRIESAIVNSVGLVLSGAEMFHGRFPLPAPAVAAIVRAGGLSCTFAVGQHESATPTGVALLAAMREVLGVGDGTGKVLRVGYGAGSRDLEGVANVVQGFVLLEKENFPTDTVGIVEVYVDDLSGEALGGIVDDLLAWGARDAWYVPAHGKKGRPGFEVTVLCDAELRWSCADELRRRVGSPGARVGVTERAVEPVNFVEARVLGECVRIKESFFGAKPEWDDVVRVASVLALSRAEVSQRAMACYFETRLPGGRMER